MSNTIQLIRKADADIKFLGDLLKNVDPASGITVWVQRGPANDDSEPVEIQFGVGSDELLRRMRITRVEDRDALVAILKQQHRDMSHFLMNEGKQ